jgi:hypothetical protein
MYVEKEYCAKHRWQLVNKSKRAARTNPFSSTAAPGSGQSSLDQYDLSIDDNK